MPQDNDKIESAQRTDAEVAETNNQNNANQVQTYERTENIVKEKKERVSSDTTIFRGALMITNLCFGVTIFTFAIRATYFGLVWLVVAGAIVGLVTYWSLMLCVIASSKNEEDDYSELTEKILGKKVRIFLNIIIIIYSYAVMMMFMALTYSLFGRFIHATNYTEKYPDLGITLGLCFMCLIRDINKLDFSSYIGVGAVVYSLIVVLVQCHDYYKDSKNKYYIEEDD